MAVSVVQRPVGVITTTAFDDVGVSVDGSGAYFFTQASNGIAIGDYVYLKTPQEAYNGFKYVFFADSITFRFRVADYQGGTNVAWQRREIATDGTAQYKRSLSTHGWNCVHLPIIYRLSNTLWPTNTADTVRTISSVTDSNGYCALSLSGDIKASGSAAALEFIKITSATDDDLNGVWQIVAYTNDTTFTIAIPYSSANDTALTGASIQYYYNNYHVKVNVYGGLDSDHFFEDQKPYELLATLSLVPDENSECFFSINEILKSQINVRNNLLLGNLPNNLDAFTQFYIEYAEAYDDSDGTTLSTTTSSFTDDSANFDGYAVNAMLPFKDVNSGSLSEFVTGDTTSRFLTDFETPIIFTGRFFDISFINIYAGVGFSIREEYYLNGSLQTTEETEFTTLGGNDEGVYRARLTDPDCDYDRVDVEIFISDTAELSNGDFDDGLTDWSNAGSGQTWSASASEAVVTVTGVQNSKRLEHSYNFYSGCSYEMNWDLSRGSSGGGDNFLVTAYLSNDDFTATQVVGGEGPFTTDGSSSIVDTFTANADYTKLVFIVTANVA